jgi:hypothetical protein
MLSTTEKRDVTKLRRIVALADEILSLTGDDGLFLTVLGGEMSIIQDSALKVRVAAANALVVGFEDTSAVMKDPPHQVDRSHVEVSHVQSK